MEGIGFAPSLVLLSTGTKPTGLSFRDLTASVLTVVPGSTRNHHLRRTPRVVSFSAVEPIKMLDNALVVSKKFNLLIMELLSKTIERLLGVHIHGAVTSVSMMMFQRF